MLNQNGFTLLEMMVAVAVVAILMAVGLPSFDYVIKTNRISSQANTIVGTFQYARSEAVNRGVNVRVEPIVDGKDWSRGWQVRIDGNDNNDFNDTTEDIVIKNFDGIENGTLTTTQEFNIFYPGGDTDVANTLELRASECDGDFKRIINVNLSGLVTINSDKSC